MVEEVNKYLPDVLSNIVNEYRYDLFYIDRIRIYNDLEELFATIRDYGFAWQESAYLINEHNRTMGITNPKQRVINHLCLLSQTMKLNNIKDKTRYMLNLNNAAKHKGVPL